MEKPTFRQKLESMLRQEYGAAAEISNCKIKWLICFAKEIFQAEYVLLLSDFTIENQQVIRVNPRPTKDTFFDEETWNAAYAKIANKIDGLPEYLDIPSFKVVFVREYGQQIDDNNAESTGSTARTD